MRNLIGVHPMLAFAVTEAIKITKQDFTVFEGVRSFAKQKRLVEKGMSKTYKSYHLNGLAVDLVAWVDGRPSWQDELYPEIHKAMKIIIDKYGFPIDNGFDLWGWDKPHWQLTGLRDQYDIRKIDPKRFPNK